MKFIVFHIPNAACTFLTVNKNFYLILFAAEGKRKLLDLSIVQARLLLDFCIMLAFELLNRGVCGMRPVDHHDWHWNLVRDQITSSRSPSMCGASWFNSIRSDLVFFFFFLKIKESTNTEDQMQQVSLVQSVPISFSFLPHRKQSQCGKWFERQVFVWLKSIDTQVFNIYVHCYDFLPLAFAHSHLFCSLFCSVHAFFFIFCFRLRRKKGDHSKSLDGRRQSLCRTIFILAIACMHSCVHATNWKFWIHVWQSFGCNNIDLLCRHKYRLVAVQQCKMRSAEVVFVIYVLIFLMVHGNAHIYGQMRRKRQTLNWRTAVEEVEEKDDDDEKRCMKSHDKGETWKILCFTSVSFSSLLFRCFNRQLVILIFFCPKHLIGCSSSSSAVTVVYHHHHRKHQPHRILSSIK